ncbi:MAG: 5-(carboxyamino)imidazole ribonucleotide mutase [Candidatus Omnitrophota bacterium]
MQVAIVLGSKSDLEKIQDTIKTLKEFGVSFDLKIFSAHRAPKDLEKYINNLTSQTKVVIAAAGMSAALPGVIAAHTILPVIGIPIEAGSLKGMDALLSIVQMPPGVPVGSMAIGGAKNAAIFAIEILATQDKKLKNKLISYKQNLRKACLQSSLELMPKTQIKKK